MLPPPSDGFEGKKYPKLEAFKQQYFVTGTAQFFPITRVFTHCNVCMYNLSVV